MKSKYKSLMELQGIIKGKVTLEEMENAEARAAHERFERCRKS